MFYPLKESLRTLKSSGITTEKTKVTKNNYYSIFEAIDKATKVIGEGKLIDPTKQTIEQQMNTLMEKLREMAVSENPSDLDDKEGYMYLGSAAQENFYAKFDYDIETKQLNNIQVINSVDEEVASVQNDDEQTSAQVIADIVDQLKLDSVSFKILVDVGAIDIAEDSITPEEGIDAEGGGGGAPMAPDAGSGSQSAGSATAAGADSGMGNDETVPGTQGGQLAGPEGPEGGADDDTDKKKQFILGQGKESRQVSGIPANWSTTLKEATSLFESTAKAKESKVRLPAGKYQIVEKGKKISLVAKVISEKIVSSKHRFIIANEDVNITVTGPDGNTSLQKDAAGVSVSVDSSSGEQVNVSSTPETSPAAAVNQVELPVGSLDDIDLGTPEPGTGEGEVEPLDMDTTEPTGGSGDATTDATKSAPEDEDKVGKLKKDDEFEVHEGRLRGHYKVLEVKNDLWGLPKTLVCEKSKEKKDWKKDKKAKSIKEASMEPPPGEGSTLPVKVTAGAPKLNIPPGTGVAGVQPKSAASVSLQVPPGVGVSSDQEKTAAKVNYEAPPAEGGGMAPKSPAGHATIKQPPMNMSSEATLESPPGEGSGIPPKEEPGAHKYDIQPGVGGEVNPKTGGATVNQKYPREGQNERRLREAKQIVKIRPEAAEGPWVTNPQEIKQVLMNPQSPDMIVDFVDGGKKGVMLLSHMQGEQVQVGIESVKVAILGAPDQTATPAGHNPESGEPVPITPAEAGMGNAITPNREGKLPDVINYGDGTKIIKDLLEKHGILEGEAIHLEYDGSSPALEPFLDKGGAAGSAQKPVPGTTDDPVKEGDHGAPAIDLKYDGKSGSSKPELSTKTSAGKAKQPEQGVQHDHVKEDSYGEGTLQTGEVNRDDKGGGIIATAGTPASANDKKNVKDAGFIEPKVDKGVASDKVISTSTLEAKEDGNTLNTTSPASKDDAGGKLPNMSKDNGELDQKNIVTTDKGGMTSSKTSSPASKDDAGGTMVINKDGQGEVHGGEGLIKDAGAGPVIPEGQGEGGAKYDASNADHKTSVPPYQGGSGQYPETTISTSTLESRKRTNEYIMKLEKEMKEAKHPEMKQTIKEMIEWIKSSLK